jgi:hypothetical protein
VSKDVQEFKVRLVSRGPQAYKGRPEYKGIPVYRVRRDCKDLLEFKEFKEIPVFRVRRA